MKHFIVLLLLITGCCSTDTSIKYVPIKVNVPVIVKDTVPANYDVLWTHIVDSVMTELERTGMYPETTRIYRDRVLTPRQYRGEFSTERGDSAGTTFNFTSQPFFSDWWIKLAPVDTGYTDTTRTVHVDEYSFFAKIGYAVLFIAIGFALSFLKR